MKTASPKTLLVLISLAIALLFSAGAFYYFKDSSLSSQNIAVLIFGISFISCLLVLLVVNLLVFTKVKHLRYTIRKFRSSNDMPFGEQVYGNNEIENLHSEILAWADERKNEIERLKKLEAYRREFLGNVSHELKTPGFNIQGYILTLLDGGLEDPSINRNYLSRAEKSVERMITIIDDLEAISQLETGELQLEPEKFDLTVLAKDVFEALELKATAKGIILSLPNENKPFFVLADRFRIRQVLVNLVVNSIKYGKEYGETQIRFYENGDYTTVEVADNGIGISKEHLPRLFERFYRVDKSRSRDQGGTGLGLSIVKHIIEAHNQTVTVTSTEGVGTTFTFTLKRYNLNG